VGRPASEGVFVEEQFLHPDLGFSLRFPHGWTLSNQAAQVVGLSPKRDGVVLLQLDSPGPDPEAAAAAYAQREGLRLENRSAVRVGGLPAYRAEAVVPTSFGRTHAEITWVAHEGRIYRLIGGMSGGQLKKYEGLFRKFAQSFRPLSSEEASTIEDLRLRSVRAREGETLAALSSRVNNQWDLTFTSVVNNLFTHDVLAEGQRVKVAVKERYEPEPADTEEHAAAAE
jgi:predicted Zn-dependent protease